MKIMINQTFQLLPMKLPQQVDPICLPIVPQKKADSELSFSQINQARLLRNTHNTTT